MIHSRQAVQNANKKQLMTLYRAQLSGLAALERHLVDLGYLEPGQRRILNRAERRQQTQGERPYVQK